MTTGTSGQGKRVTIRDVALSAGVSPAAVSKVLTGASGVSEALRCRVEAAILSLGYRPLTTARAMRGRTFTLGVVLPDITNPFFSEIISGAQGFLAATRYHALIGISQAEPAVERRLIDGMIDLQVDGVILLGAIEDSLQLSEIGRAIPTVAIGHRPLADQAFDTVNDDDALGAGLAVKHLAAQGYRKITMLSLQTRRETIVTDRESGYLDVMAQIGPANILRLGQDLPTIRMQIGQLLTSPERPEAIFAWADWLALEVISIARQIGLRIPQDLGLIGYDNTPPCGLHQNGLSSIDQQGRHLGSEAARLLIERIEGRREPVGLIVTPMLVPRRSSDRFHGVRDDIDLTNCPPLQPSNIGN